MMAAVNKGPLEECSFIIDGEIVKADKHLLASSSTVFEKMLYGPLSSKEIILPDVNIVAFKQMLVFLQTRKVMHQKSVKEAWDLYYIAHKYFLTDLSLLCVQFIKKNLSLSTLAISYELSTWYSIKALEEICWEDMVYYCKGVLLLDVNYHMKISTMLHLLTVCKHLTHSDVIFGIVNWAVRECNSKEIELTTENVADKIIETGLIKFIDPSARYRISCDDKFISDCVMCIKEVCKEACNLKASFCRFGSYSHGKCQEREVYNIPAPQRVPINRRYEYCYDVLKPYRKVILIGILVNTVHNPLKRYICTFPCYEIITVLVWKANTLISRTMVEGEFSNVSHKFIRLNDLIILDTNKKYRIEVEYRCKDVRFNYFSDRLYNNKGKVDIVFCESKPSVIKGISYYPV